MLWSSAKLSESMIHLIWIQEHIITVLKESGPRSPIEDRLSADLSSWRGALMGCRDFYFSVLQQAYTLPFVWQNSDAKLC